MKKLTPLVVVLVCFTALIWMLGFLAGKHVTDKAGANLTITAGRSTGFGRSGVDGALQLESMPQVTPTVSWEPPGVSMFKLYQETTNSTVLETSVKPIVTGSNGNWTVKLQQ